MNRIDDEDLMDRLPQLVRNEVLGPVAVPIPPSVNLQHALTQVLYVIGEGGIQAQWGILPPNAVLDASVPAIDRPSWILDLDSFLMTKTRFDPPDIVSSVKDLADRAYRYFRWAVHEEFLEEFKERR
jgi:uncharacterized protein (TIGR04255 family)